MRRAQSPLSTPSRPNSGHTDRSALCHKRSWRPMPRTCYPPIQYVPDWNVRVRKPPIARDGNERAARRWGACSRSGIAAARIETQRNISTLTEVHQYGVDSFADPDYIRLYGMIPAQWYAHGVRLLGRTAVECTRDPLGDRIGRDVASVATLLPPQTKFTVIDPFAGSCNTLYWILRHVPRSTGIAFELDPQVHELTTRNIAGLDREIALTHGDYEFSDGRIRHPRR